MKIYIKDDLIDSLKSIMKIQMIENDDSLSDDERFINEIDLIEYINIMIENHLFEFNHRISK